MSEKKKPCKDCGCPVNAKINRTKPTADELVARLAEAIHEVEKIADMLQKAMDDAKTQEGGE